MTAEILDLAGDAHARGAAFGALRRRQIAAWMGDWLGSLRAAGTADPHAYIAAMLHDTDFLTAIRRHTPDLLEEVQGIARGAEQPAELLLAAQFMDEEWAYRVRSSQQTDARQKCSSLAIASQRGVTWIGQNMDLGRYTDGHQLLLRIAPESSEPGSLIFTVGGMIGLLGVNSKGVGVCVNSMRQLPSTREGLPVAFVIRKLLQASSAQEAAEIVCALPHATSQHYLIADPTHIRSFEVSSEAIVEYHSPDRSRVLHTNHPLTTRQQSASTESDQADTLARLRSLTSRLMSGAVDLKAIQAALSSADDPAHPVCKLPPNDGQATEVTGFTTGSMISALRHGAATVESWVSAGPPSVRRYTQVSSNLQ